MGSKKKTTSTDWIHEWKGLSEYVGGVSVRTLQRYQKAGIIRKYRLGKKVMFRKSEVDETILKTY